MVESSDREVTWTGNAQVEDKSTENEKERRLQKEAGECIETKGPKAQRQKGGGWERNGRLGKAHTKDKRPSWRNQSNKACLGPKIALHPSSTPFIL